LRDWEIGRRSLGDWGEEEESGSWMPTDWKKKMANEKKIRR
jgi:hypothetical protein